MKRTRRVAAALISLAQHPLDIGIVGSPTVKIIEISDRLGQAVTRDRQPAAVDHGLGVVGVGDKPVVHPDARSSWRSPEFKNLPDDSHWPRPRETAGDSFGGVSGGRGIRWCIPIDPTRSELVANPPQIPDQNGLLHGGGDQLRPVGAEGQRERSGRLQGRQPDNLPTGSQRQRTAPGRRRCPRPSTGRRP